MSWDLREGLAATIAHGRDSSSLYVRDLYSGASTLAAAPGTDAEGRRVYVASLDRDDANSQVWRAAAGDVVGGEVFYRIVCTAAEAATFAAASQANAAALNRRWEAVIFRMEREVAYVGFVDNSDGVSWAALGETDMPVVLRDANHGDREIARLTFVARPPSAAFRLCSGRLDDSLVLGAPDLSLGGEQKILAHLWAEKVAAESAVINSLTATEGSATAPKFIFARSDRVEKISIGRGGDIGIPADPDAAPPANLADIPAGQFVSAKGIRELVRPVLEGDNGLLTFGDARPTAADGDDKAAGHLWIFGRERYVRLGTARGAGADQTISGWRRINGAVRVFDGSEPHPSGNVLDLVGEDFADYVLGGGVRRWKWDDFGFLNFFVSSADTDGLAGTYTTRRDDFRRTFHTGYGRASNTVFLNLSAGLSAAQFDAGGAYFPGQQKDVISKDLEYRTGGDLERYARYWFYAASFRAEYWRVLRSGDSAFDMGGLQLGVRPSVKSIWGVIGK